MINDLDIVQWDYLLSPEFEMVNSAGKPLTGGYIEVYIHGTRNKYYCASDFNGTLHPFQIPLDSLGSNIVLASPDNAYDVYVYNKYGSLIMSRYNVHCQGTGGGGGSYAGDKLFYGQYTAHNVAETASLSKTKGNIDIDSDGYLQLKQGMSYHITVRGAFQVNDVTNTETTLNYIEYSTISPIKVDVDFTKADPQNFELSYDIYDLAEDMAYQVAFEQINGMVTDLVVEVHSLSNLATTATFNYEAGDYISIVDNTISVTGINPEDYSTHSETYESIVTAIQLVTGIVPSDAATHDEVYEATVTAINFVTGAIPTPEPELPLVAGDGIIITEYEDRVEIAANVTSIEGYATESFVTGYVEQAISGIPEQQQADWEQDDDTAVDYIKNKPDLDIYATHDEVNTVSGEIVETVNNVSSVLHEEMIEIGQAATGLIPDVSDFATHEDVFESAVTSIQLVTGMIPDVSDYATHGEVHESIVSAVEYVTGIIPEAQVQSNWTETDNEDPSYIQNKPNELPLVAGDGITITEDLDHITIAANVTSIDGYATIAEVNTVSSVLHEEIQNIPEYTAGDYINIDNYEINVTGLQPEGDYATHTDLIEAVSSVTGIGDYGQFYATNITGAATMAKTKGTIDVTNDGKIKLKQGQSYHVTVRGRYNQTTAANDYGDISYIEYITNNSIHVNVDKTITDSQYFEISYDLYKLNSDSNYYIFFSMTGGTVNDLFIEIHAIGSVGVGGSGGGGTEYDAGWGIQILNNVISVDPSILNQYVTQEELATAIDNVIEIVTGTNIQNVVEYVDAQTTPNFFNDCVALLEQGIEPVAKYQDNVYQLWRVQTSGNTYTGLGFICTAFQDFQYGGISYEHQNAYNWQLWADANGVYPGAYRKGYNYLAGDGINAVTGVVNGEHAITYSINPMEVATAVSGLIPTVTGITVNNVIDYNESDLYNKVDAVVNAGGSPVIKYTTNDGVTYYFTEFDKYTVNNTTHYIFNYDNSGGGYYDLQYACFRAIISIDSNGNKSFNTEYLKYSVKAGNGIDAVTGTTGATFNIDAMEVATAISGLLPTAPTYSAGNGIDITNNTISVDNTVAMKTDIPDVSNFVTETELQDGLELVTGLIPTDYASDEELQDAIELVTGLIPAAQVQSDWTQSDNTKVDYIKNKPAVTNLVAGDGITITESSNDLVISCTVTATPAVSGYVTDEELQDAIELVTGLIPDTSDLATKAELQDGLELVTGLIPTDYATHAEVNNVSGAIINEIPDVSDFVTEAQVTAMLPEEEEVEFLAVEAGSGINIVQSATGIIISCSVTGGGASYTAGNGIDITNNEISIDNTVALKTDIPVVTGFATKAELQDGLELVTGLIPDVSNLATKAELQTVTGLIPTDYATDEELQDAVELVTGLIPDVSNLATKAELQDGLELVTGLIPTDYASDEELQDAVELVTGMIPSYTAGDHISIENNEIAVTGTEDITLMNLAAGQNISITIDGSTVEIACTGIPDVTNYATHAEVNNVSGAIVNEIPDVSDFVTEAQVTALIPEEEEVDFLSVNGGNCIEITSDVSGNAEIAWHTTAGITDIQMVTALPASPVSSILYIIPEA